MMQIEEITREVIRRLEVITSDKKALVCVEHAENVEIFGEFCKKVVQEGYILTKCILPGQTTGQTDFGEVHHTISVSEDEAYRQIKELIRNCDMLILCGVRIGQLVDFWHLEIHTPLMCLLYEAALKGKKICVFSDDLRLHTASRAFRNEVLRILLALREWGICFPGLDMHMVSEIRKSFISLQDVKEIKDGMVCIHEDAVVAASAEKYISDHGILVVRQKPDV